MHYYQEKLNVGKQLKSTADMTIEIDEKSIIYRGTFYVDFKRNDKPDGVTFKHELYINKLNGDFLISYEILNKRSGKGRLKANSWIKKNGFDKLQNLTQMGFYKGEKRRGFWGVKYDRKTSEFFEEIKVHLQSDMESDYLKNKTYYKPVVNRLYDLLVDYHLYKKGIKGHDNVYYCIQTVYPKKKWLKLNDNKFLPAILDEHGIKSKYLIKELSIKERPVHMNELGSVGVNIRGLIYLCTLFGENHIDYIKKFDWTRIANTPFTKTKKHTCKSDVEKNALVEVFSKHIKRGDSVGNVNDPPRVHNILLTLHKLIEVRNLLEEQGYVLKLKLKTPDDIELLLPYWMVIKKSSHGGFVMKYKIPQEIIDDIQAPITLPGKIFYPRVLLSDLDFSLEGLEMKNCMAKQFLHGAIYIYISLSYGKTKINLQYQKGILIQSHGKANSSVPTEIFGVAIMKLNERMEKHDTLKWEREKVPLPPKPF